MYVAYVHKHACMNVCTYNYISAYVYVYIHTETDAIGTRACMHMHTFQDLTMDVSTYLHIPYMRSIRTEADSTVPNHMHGSMLSSDFAVPGTRRKASNGHVLFRSGFL